jgi:hypothetical protein
MLKFICFLSLSLVSITVNLLEYEIATILQYTLHLGQHLAYLTKMMQAMRNADSVERAVLEIQILGVHLKELHGLSFKPLFRRFHLLL